ncbi:MAG: cytochrome c [Thiotrichales bacterium]|nr:cytochrome c [Thiotrichales bacterium]MBT3614228.1 cytochrome c [Thiotrichales bacterium]MBT3752046.1 cytochrome c [Thiotrichales bacterium]MBT3837429.1 cytochrome c [Thiotrichales bacterium]MBT4152714.1 cytochrome c [Thiotrichales bacterium]
MDRKTLLGWGVLLVLLFIVVQLSKRMDGNSVSNGRWYSEQQVEQGKELFKLHCATCHGPEAASVYNWRDLDENGKYPAPPLNGSGHTWHHSLSLLKKTVREGGLSIGGQMPSFKDMLSDEEIDSILAWVQTHWSDKIYSIWEGRNG